MNTLDVFYKVTGYNVMDYVNRYNQFMSDDFGKIVAYYKGNSNVDKSCFHNLIKLIADSDRVDSLYDIHSSSLSINLDFWLLQDMLSEFKTSLQKVMNLGKWMRSSYVLGFENNAKIQYILKQNQSLENLSQELGSFEPNEDWVEIALDNALREVDYNLSGGNLLSVKKTANNKEYNIQTTVDFMVGENVLGKDIDIFIQFIDDDVLTLSPKDTMIQSAYICLNTVKGSLPKNVNIGVSKSFVGSNIFTYRSGALIREVLDNFRTDDSFKSVELTDFVIEKDVVRYDFKIVSKLNDEINLVL